MEDTQQDVSEVVDGTESSTIQQDPDPAPQDVSGTLAVIFVLAMIVGILVFDMLSKRWHS